MPHCHYEILSISMDADDSAIKKSYRKLALKYHPDKNQDNLEHATEQFRLVQAAYDCLSDPHERQWYDDHRDAILKGKKIGAENGSDSEMNDDGQDLYGFMTGLAFEGFDEELKPKTNYFAVYHELFQRIDEEEPSTGKSQREDGPLPVFGNSASCWEDVNMFYGYWEGFSTRKTYGYLDKWDTRQAPDRWVRRKMEQENKKVREEARKNKNKIVRELVRFVRRRDPRVAKQKEKLEEENQRKKKLQEDKRKERLAAEIEAQVEYEEKMWEDENTWRQYEELAELEAKLEAEEENDEFAFTGKRGKKGKKGKKNKKKWSSDDEEIIVEENPVDENGKNEIKDSDQDLENKSVPTPSHQPKKKGKKGKKNKNKTPSEKPAPTKKNWRLNEYSDDEPKKESSPQKVSETKSETDPVAEDGVGTNKEIKNQDNSIQQTSSKKPNKKNKKNRLADYDEIDTDDLDMDMLKITTDDEEEIIDSKSSKKKGKKKGKKR